MSSKLASPPLSRDALGMDVERVEMPSNRTMTLAAARPASCGARLVYLERYTIVSVLKE